MKNLIIICFVLVCVPKMYTQNIVADMYKGAINYIKEDNPKDRICVSDSTYSVGWFFFSNKTKQLTFDTIMDIYITEMGQRPIFNDLLYEIQTEDDLDTNANRIVHFSKPYKNVICCELRPIPTWKIGIFGEREFPMYLFLYDKFGNIIGAEKTILTVD